MGDEIFYFVNKFQSRKSRNLFTQEIFSPYGIHCIAWQYHDSGLVRTNKSHQYNTFTIHNLIVQYLPVGIEIHTFTLKWACSIVEGSHVNTEDLLQLEHTSPASRNRPVPTRLPTPHIGPAGNHTSANTQTRHLPILSVEASLTDSASVLTPHSQKNPPYRTVITPYSKNKNGLKVLRGKRTRCVLAAYNNLHKGGRLRINMWRNYAIPFAYRTIKSTQYCELLNHNYSVLISTVRWFFLDAYCTDHASRIANQHTTTPGQVSQYLHKETEAGRLIRASPEHPVHSSPIDLIPKGNQPGRWRLITDLSSPKGGSVNDTISPLLCSLK